MIAQTHPDDERLATLRDQLVARLGGSPDRRGALAVVDHVYLGRTVAGLVAPILAAQCVQWYGHWRSPDESAANTTALRDLTRAWIDEPERRPEVDERIIVVARAVVGWDPPQLADAPV